MNYKRSSGILMHITSLPGPYGIGELGSEAYKFADMLSDMGQGLWQILPFGPTGYGDSPYQSFSTFAGNPLWISLELLAEKKLISKKALKEFSKFPEDSVDYGPVIIERMKLLNVACANFEKKASRTEKKEFETFRIRNAEWLNNFALFMALKEEQGGGAWHEWPVELIQREPDAIREAERRLEEQILMIKTQQFLFEQQWKALQTYCHEKGISMIGDIPIFVAHDSADAWSHPSLFYLDDHGQPTVVAGVPPDYFSATGQLWGNPLYNWSNHQSSSFKWWKHRLKRIFDMVDIVRIDHFRGFEAYWEVPADETTAMNGQWVKGPGKLMFNQLLKDMGQLNIIAEDLGVITKEVEELRDAFDFPGMRILQFAFGSDDQADTFLPDRYPMNCVVYTGTHDNDTTIGWFHSKAGKDSTRTEEQIKKEQANVLNYVGTDGHAINWDMIEVALRSNAVMSVVPMQDVLGLDSSARMNIPGRESGNWQWRFQWKTLNESMIKKMRHLTRATGRLSKSSSSEKA